MNGFEKDGYWWFDCGCRFKIIGPRWGRSKTPKLQVISDLHNPNHTVNFYCSATWELLSKGWTKGVFQLESKLGQQWCKKLKPENMENMAALGALLRPGCLRAKSFNLVCKDCKGSFPIHEDGDNDHKEQDFCPDCGSDNVKRVGISMTEHYCFRKNGIEQIEKYHPAVDPILGPTYNVLCIHEDTNISLSDGSIIPIKDLYKGVLVDSFNEKTLKIEPNRCQGVGFSKIDDGIKIILENNSYIILTNDHDIFTLDGIKQAGKLNLGDFVYTSNMSNLNKNIFNITELGNNKYIAYIFGQILGNGNFGKNICCGKDEAVTDKLIDFIKNNLTKHEYKKYWHCRSWYISLFCKELLNNKYYGNRKTKWRHILESYGLTNSCKNKYIDNKILSKWDIESKIAFLAGVIESDGHLGKDVVHITSSSKFVINGLKQLLLQLGIPSYISKNYNRIYPRNIKKLIELISPYLLYKKYNGSLIDDSDYGSYPKHILLSECKKEQLSQAKFTKKYGISKENLVLRKGGNNIVKYGIIKKINYNTGDVRPLRVKAIEKVQSQKFYKMSVENNHNLVGNGFIIKNCYQEQSMQIVQAVANFDLKEADILRKAIGKKLPEEMAKVKTLYMEKVKEAKIVSEHQAEEIFGWIEKSQRYSFNKCIRGNTIICRASKNHHMLGYGYTVAHMYNIRNSIVYAKENGQLSLYKKWKLLDNYGKGLSMCEDGRVRPNIIKDITYEGIKDVYRVVLETNQYIDVTNNHKFPTPTGEKKLAELKIGDNIFVKGSYEESNFKDINRFSNIKIEELRQIAKNRNHDNKTKGFMYGKNNPGYTDGSYTKFKNNKSKLPRCCDKCGNIESRLECHHIDGDRSNSKLENLVILCSSCHKKIEYQNGRVRRGEKGYPSLVHKIKSIEYIGTDDVYNVEMDEPNHNFVVNDGIITSNSHAASYGETGYVCAFLKTHFPLGFYCKWLQYANEKQKPQEEIAELVNDARITCNIKIRPPDIRFLRTNVHSDGESIYFGLQDIKEIGTSQINKLKETLLYYNITKEDLDKIEWFTFLMFIGDKISSKTMLGFINSGALSCFKRDRVVMVKEYNIWSDLTPAEKYFTKKYYAQLNKSPDSIQEILHIIIDNKGYSKKTRLEILHKLLASIENIPYNLEDTIDYLVHHEQELIGTPLSCHITDSLNNAHETHSCKDIVLGYKGYAVLKVCLEDVREWKIKNGPSSGENMAFVKASDNTCQIDNIVIFPNIYNQYSYLLSPGNMLYITGKISQKGSFTIERVYEHK